MPRDQCADIVSINSEESSYTSGSDDSDLAPEVDEMDLETCCFQCGEAACVLVASCALCEIPRELRCRQCWDDSRALCVECCTPMCACEGENCASCCGCDRLLCGRCAEECVLCLRPHCLANGCARRHYAKRKDGRLCLDCVLTRTVPIGACAAGINAAMEALPAAVSDSRQ